MNRELFNAAQGNNIEKVKELIEKGADVNAKNEYGSTALMLASCYGYKQIVESLIEAGADINVKDLKGETLLMRACVRGNIKIVESLIEAGAR